MLVAYTDAGLARNSSSNVKGQAFHAYAIFEINSKGEKKLIEGEIFKSGLPTGDIHRLELYSIEKLITKLHKMSFTGIHIYSDSKIVVDSINGLNNLYNVDLYVKTRNELNDLKSKIEWISREDNGLCDAAVSSGDLSFFYYIGKNKISLRTKLKMKFGKNDFKEIIPVCSPKTKVVKVTTEPKDNTLNKTEKEKQELALRTLNRWIKNGNEYKDIKVNSIAPEYLSKIISTYGSIVKKENRKDTKEITEWLIKNNMPIIEHGDMKKSLAHFIMNNHSQSDLTMP